MTAAPAGAVRRVQVQWVGYPERRPAETTPAHRARPDVLVLAVQLTQVGAGDLPLLAGVRDEADIVAAVIYSPRGAGRAGEGERAVLRAIRENADVVVHGSDPELIHDVLSGIGEIEDSPASADR